MVGGLASQQETPLRTQAGIGLILLVVGFRGVLVLLTQGREGKPRTTPRSAL